MVLYTLKRFEISYVMLKLLHVPNLWNRDNKPLGTMYYLSVLKQNTIAKGNFIFFLA